MKSALLLLWVSINSLVTKLDIQNYKLRTLAKVRQRNSERNKTFLYERTDCRPNADNLYAYKLL